MTKHYPKGLDDRQRDQNGEIRRKRGDTLIGTLRNEYGQNFAPGCRADMKLQTLLDKECAKSLHELLNTK
jgi:hypothetical protein